MSLHLHNKPVCIDARMIGVDATGVASYATTLRAMVRMVTDRPMLLGSVPSQPARSRIRRLFAAARLGERHAELDETAGSERQMGVADLFREAQVHFDIYGRMLAVRPPFPGGIMHWTYPVPLRMAGWINVYTVHDAIPLVHPDLTPINPRRHRRLLERIAAAADRIVTVSDAARADIVAALGCPAGLVEMVPGAIELSAVTADLPPPLVAGDYLLVCGSIEPRKNIARILAAYRASGVVLPLVIAGPDGWRAAELAPAIAATPGVLRLRWQRREVMDALIGHARALVMPSLAEGFGLPVAEAMARGTPVVTSNIGALAEIGGDAALLADPLDVADLAVAIRRIVRDSALRARLTAAGRRRAESFTTAHVAPRLAAVYADLVASRRGTAYPPTPQQAGETN